MAICKHISCRNSFGGALEYLTMAHDCKGHTLWDKDGRPLPRENCLIDGINCIPETFAPLCLDDRIRFGKKHDSKAITTHQYILSFAPSDIKKGLTMEEAHQFGCQLARENFSGHRILVCTHPDGEQHSGNIHVHIIVGSIRFEDRSADLRFMRKNRDGTVKPSEYRAGCAHQDTAALRKRLLSQINSYCLSRGYEVCPEKASEKITSGEYYVRKSGMESWHDQLRHAIADAAATTASWELFAEKLTSAYTYRAPVIPPIPYPIRKKLWQEYKLVNSCFWKWEKETSAYYRAELASAFKELKACKNKTQRSDIRTKIDSLKEEQAKERVFRKIYQTYSRAASIALHSRNLEDARFCLEQMQELSRRCDGYWEEGWDSNSASFSLTTGIVHHRVLWKQITQSELQMAEKVLSSIQVEAMSRKEKFSEYIEKPMPVEVKISRGAVSFRHPDSPYWVRGKRLGTDYTLESLGVSPSARSTPGYNKSRSYYK